MFNFDLSWKREPPPKREMRVIRLIGGMMGNTTAPKPAFVTNRVYVPCPTIDVNNFRHEYAVYESTGTEICCDFGDVIRVIEIFKFKEYA